MRSSILILTATSSCLVDAGWVKLPGHRELAGRGGTFTARETRAVAAAVDEIRGWTTKPTPPPGSVSESDDILELLLREKRATSSNTWLDGTTCGWTAGVSSAPFTCSSRQTCSTNSDNVVGCASGTTNQPFFTVCLDYQAYKQGSCSSIGPKTGCCQSSSFGSCGTFLWTGSPTRSMYRCFPTETTISMIDEPQEVLDASTTSSSTSRSSSATSSGNSTPTDADDEPSSGSNNNTGAIVGGVVGGVAALGLIGGVIAWIVMRSKHAGRNKQAYNPVPPTDPSNQGAGTQQQVQMASGYGPVAALTPGSSTFPYPTGLGTATHPGAYDPQRPYYDPAKQSPGQVLYSGYPEQQQQHLFPGQSPSLGVSPPVSPPVGTGGYNPQHSIVSELSGEATPAGHQRNPAEIGSGR